jgi:hypothetical protein
MHADDVEPLPGPGCIDLTKPPNFTASSKRGPTKHGHLWDWCGSWPR